LAETDFTPIYLDTNVYSRPFDDQVKAGIAAEANAFLEIVDAIKAGNLKLVSSDILLFEVYNILSEDKRAKVESYLDLCSEHIHSSEEILNLGRQLERECHIRARDALHVASAAFGNARYFLSCDQKVTQKKQARCYRRLLRLQRNAYFSVMNPTRFVEKMHKGELE
jgi:predicted nucleic acid-binding protein